MKLEIMDIEIKDAPLSGRTKNCLKFAGIQYVSTLPQLEAMELLHIPNMGRKSVEEVIEYLHSIGVALKGQDKFYKRKQQLPWVVRLIEEAVAKERLACFDAAYDANATTDVLKAIKARGEA